MIDLIRIDREDAVAILTIDHPPANALSQRALAELQASLSVVGDDDRVRALVLTGEGDRYFVAGADISEMESSPEETKIRTERGQRLTLSMERSRLPIIAAINGYALGGGLELAMACDLRIARAGTRVGQPEVKLGLIPGWGGTQRLPRIIGRGPALALLMTGDMIDAEEALRIGLVDEVVAAEELRPRALLLAQKLANQSPVAIAAIKRAMADGLELPLAEGLAAELDAFMTAAQSADGKEGVAAFLAKRPARWTGH